MLLIISEKCLLERINFETSEHIIHDPDKISIIL